MRTVIYRIISVVLLINISLVAGLLVFGNQPVYADNFNPGCYIHEFPGWQTKNCQDLVRLYPNFQPNASACYFTWDESGNPSPPVLLPCNAGPSVGQSKILPANNQPGNPPQGSTSGSGTASGSCTSGSTDPACCNGNNQKGGNLEKCLQQNPLVNDLQLFINVLAGAVGIVVVGSIIVAGFQYTTARDNPQMVSAAKVRILNAVIALLAFIFLYAFLQWLVPGGVF